MYGDVNITNAFENAIYPTPVIIPDTTNSDKNADTGIVCYDFIGREYLADYQLVDGFALQSALGITEEQLRYSARQHLTELYQSTDIVLEAAHYTRANQDPRILIPYRVNLK